MDLSDKNTDFQPITPQMRIALGIAHGKVFSETRGMVEPIKLGVKEEAKSPSAVLAFAGNIELMPKTIVAIGGGLIRTRSTEAIDREIIRLSGKCRPQALFIPTASSDHPLYWERFQRYFGDHLNCATDVLYLMTEHPSYAEITGKILAADIVYVGGGNTLMMMRLWRRLGVDQLLKRAYERGTVLSGISAGAICWFESGHSDSMSFYNSKKWDYINVKGLGLLKGIHCPHYDGKTLGNLRRRDFQKMIEKVGGVGIAIENNCAVKFVDEHYGVISSKDRANAYRVFNRDGKVVSQRIQKQECLLPISSLFDVSKA